MDRCTPSFLPVQGQTFTDVYSFYTEGSLTSPWATHAAAWAFGPEGTLTEAAGMWHAGDGGTVSCHRD